MLHTLRVDITSCTRICVYTCVWTWWMHGRDIINLMTTYMVLSNIIGCFDMWLCVNFCMQIRLLCFLTYPSTFASVVFEYRKVGWRTKIIHGDTSGTCTQINPCVMYLLVMPSITFFNNSIYICFYYNNFSFLKWVLHLFLYETLKFRWWYQKFKYLNSLSKYK